MGRIINKNRDPKPNEFKSDDLVLNTTTCDLFLKSKNKLFKIASRNTNTGLSTDDVLKLIPPSPAKNTILTDILEYKDIFNYAITKSWISRARDNKEIPWHIHSTSHISFVYFFLSQILFQV